MSLLSKVRAALALPAIANGDVRYQSPYDQDNHLWNFVHPDWFPNLGMTRSQAMGIPAVSRARRVICHSIASLPLRAYQGEQLASNQPIWLDRTNGVVSPYHRMLWTCDDLLFYGLSAWAVTRDYDGQVIDADRVPVDQWSLRDGVFVYVSPDGTQTEADARSVILIPGSDEGLLAHPEALTHARDLLRAATKAAENPVAYIDLHQTNDEPITAEVRDRIRADWARARSGQNGGIAFTSNGIEARELGSMSEHLLIEGRNAAALDIARQVGIPGTIVDANNGSSMTYETGQSKALDLVNYGLSAYMSPISARLGLDDVVPRGTALRFDLENLIGPGATVAAPDDGSHSTPGTPAAPQAPNQQKRPA